MSWPTACLLNSDYLASLQILDEVLCAHFAVLDAQSVDCAKTSSPDDRRNITNIYSLCGACMIAYSSCAKEIVAREGRARSEMLPGFCRRTCMPVAHRFLKVGLHA